MMHSRKTDIDDFEAILTKNYGQQNKRSTRSSHPDFGMHKARHTKKLGENYAQNTKFCAKNVLLSLKIFILE